MDTIRKTKYTVVCAYGLFAFFIFGMLNKYHILTMTGVGGYLMAGICG